MIFLSVFTLTAMTASKVTNFNHVNAEYKHLVTGYSTFIDEALLLLNARLYYRGMANVDISYHNETFISWFDKNVYSNSIINSETPIEYATPMTTCIGPNDVRYKYC